MSEETPELKANVDASRFKLAEHERNQWVITVEPNITRAHIVQPLFWAHVAAKLRPYDRVEVRCDDGTFFAELVVLETSRTWARVHVLGWADLTTRDVSLSKADVAEIKAATAPDAEYLVEWKGPHLKGTVIRVSDGTILRQGEATKAAAQAWLDDFLKATT